LRCILYGVYDAYLIARQEEIQLNAIILIQYKHIFVQCNGSQPEGSAIIGRAWQHFLGGMKVVHHNVLAIL